MTFTTTYLRLTVYGLALMVIGSLLMVSWEHLGHMTWLLVIPGGLVVAALQVWLLRCHRST